MELCGYVTGAHSRVAYSHCPSIRDMMVLFNLGLILMAKVHHHLSVNTTEITITINDELKRIFNTVFLSSVTVSDGHDVPVRTEVNTRVHVLYRLRLNLLLSACSNMEVNGD